MKTLEITPRPRSQLYKALVAKETEIRQRGRGTYLRVGPRSQRSVRWKHKMYRGSVQLLHGRDEIVTAKIRSPTAEEERRLLSSFLGFVDRHSADRVDTITIRYR
jgi:hypothetical protein